jgi:hypothetical protein
VTEGLRRGGKVSVHDTTSASNRGGPLGAVKAAELSKMKKARRALKLVRRAARESMIENVFMASYRGRCKK